MRRVDGVLWFTTPGTHHHTRSRCSRSRTSPRGPHRCPTRRRPNGHMMRRSRSPRTRGREVLPPRAAPTAIEYVQRRGQPGGPWRICAVDLAGLWVKSAMRCKAMGRSRSISKIDGAGRCICRVYPTTPCALSAFSQSDSESESESDGVCTRVARELEIASWWWHYS